MQIASTKLKGLFSGIIATGSYGLIPLFSIPPMMAGMNIGSILFFRYTIASIVMALVLMIYRISPKVSFKELVTLFFLSLLNGGTGLLLIWSYVYLSSSTATVIHFVYPVLVVMIMTIFFKEKFTLSIAVSIILALLGVMLVSGALLNEVHISLKGIMLALASVVTFALYIIGINKSSVSNMPPIKMNLYMMSFISLTLLITIPIFGTFQMGTNDVSLWINLVMLGIVATALSNVMLIKTVGYLGSTLTSIIGSNEPITAAIVGVLVFHEHITFGGYIGMILIVCSVIIAIIFKRKR